MQSLWQIKGLLLRKSKKTKSSPEDPFVGYILSGGYWNLGINFLGSNHMLTSLWSPPMWQRAYVIPFQRSSLISSQTKEQKRSDRLTVYEAHRKSGLEHVGKEVTWPSHLGALLGKACLDWMLPVFL
jgi:hypothetical protein